MWGYCLADRPPPSPAGANLSELGGGRLSADSTEEDANEEKTVFFVMMWELV